MRFTKEEFQKYIYSYEEDEDFYRTLYYEEKKILKHFTITVLPLTVNC